MSGVLYWKELKGSWKLLILLAAVLSLYITLIIGMYDPQMTDALKQFELWMPEIMAAVGMTGGRDGLMGFLSSYLYGMLLLVFPMIYTILRANGLVAKYVDQGSMAALLAAPVNRGRVAVTQLCVLYTGIVLLIGYCTGLEWAVAQSQFPGELAWEQLLRVNGGLLCLHLFLGSFCFLCSCAFGDARHSMAFGAGVPVLMYVLQMLANMGGELESFRYATVFTLFQADALAAGETWAGQCAGMLLGAGLVLSILAILLFRKKDLHL